jgi:hypothetical protein
MPPNPWARLPDEAPFLLPEDRHAIEEFNLGAKTEHKIDTGLLPEPFVGRPDAPVVLLGLNPGWSEEDAAWHENPEFARLLRANLAHESLTYPFYLLDPSQSSPGGAWWSQRLRPLIEEVGLETVARDILCVEFFPYHSHKYSQAPRLPSQDYTLSLVQAAIDRNAVVVMLRSVRRWTEAVPALANYDRRFILQSAQNVTISLRNCPLGFREITREFKR